jgi:hypothetical protein
VTEEAKAWLEEQENQIPETDSPHSPLPTKWRLMPITGRLQGGQTPPRAAPDGMIWRALHGPHSAARSVVTEHRLYVRDRRRDLLVASLCQKDQEEPGEVCVRSGCLVDRLKPTYDQRFRGFVPRATPAASPSATPASRRSIPRYCILRHRESGISPIPERLRSRRQSPRDSARQIVMGGSNRFAGDAGR